MANVTLIPKPQKQLNPARTTFRGFALDNTVDAQIDALAAKLNMSRSEFIRNIVRQIYEGEFGKGGAA